ncbi:MAG: N-acetylmuramoyl-L-alanine amidase [Bradymonadales bacterium]|jgi:N-acetyl-anhydromuramyl-L-alanine amidase AmpD
MEKYILFGGRKVPIATSFNVVIHDAEMNPSFYKPENTLGPDKLMQMALLRPTLRNFSFRYQRGGGYFTREYEQLYGTTRAELDAMGQVITQIALHHDVTMSATETFNVLCSRGLSTHFVINYDGTLFQFLDCYHCAWATGDNNNLCIAIDMNNPVFPELRDKDPASGKRELFQGKINGSVKTMLGYTEEQYETLIALMKAFITPIPVAGEEPWVPLPVVAENCFPPISDNGEVVNRMLRDYLGFKGFMGHYHCSANKWDPGPAFDWMRVLSGIKGKRNSLPVLIGEEGERRNLFEVGGGMLEQLFERYYKNAETASGGWYPVGVNQSWHSGVHLSVEEGSPVLNMMEGRIVAVRNVARVDLGDPSFVLVEHQREEDVAGQSKPRRIVWYSLFMHLQQLRKEEQSARIPWLRSLLGEDLSIPDDVLYHMDSGAFGYEKGIPNTVDATLKGADPDRIRSAFYKGDILLVSIPVDATETLGFAGQFGSHPDNLYPMIHVEVFSPENIFQMGATSAQSEAWSIVEGDASENSLVRVKRIIRPIVEANLGSTPQNTHFLKTSEIANFYLSDDDRRERFRRMICYHRSEWSPKMNWTKTAISTVGWQWESEESFGKWLLLWVPFQWMTETVTKSLGLPSDHNFFTFHPIYMLEQLNLSYSGSLRKTAEGADDSELRENTEAMEARLQELTALNAKLANRETLTDAEQERHDELYRMMDDHMDDEKGDISAETVYNYHFENNSALYEWEPGEWQVPKEKTPI